MANTQSNLSVLSVSRNISSQTFHNGFKQVTFSIDVEFLRANKFNYELYTGYDNKIITGFKYKNEIQNNKINLSYLYLPGNYNVIIKLILDDDHDILSSLDLHVPSLNDDISPMIVKFLSIFLTKLIVLFILTERLLKFLLLIPIIG